MQNSPSPRLLEELIWGLGKSPHLPVQLPDRSVSQQIATLGHQATTLRFYHLLPMPSGWRGFLAHRMDNDGERDHTFSQTVHASPLDPIKLSLDNEKLCNA
ncbi:MAG: hypothetical protein U0805_19280 [Pirellulales bacterium]